MKLKSVRAIARSLQKADVRCLFAGGIAVVAHGYGRMTFDVDVVLQLEPENIQRGFRALARLGYSPRVPVTAEQFADAAVREGWVREKGMRVLNLFSDRHRETPIDIFVEEPFDFDKAFAAARCEEIEPGVTMRFVDRRRLIAMKKRAGRPKDLDDIEHLRRLQQDHGRR
ncbi:MAG TPA: nucleotidyl transferase AbiEii/AbiGii toxin family protein [bacterium]